MPVINVNLADLREMLGRDVSLDELQENLKEVLSLCLEEYGSDIKDLPRFVGLQQVEVPL